MKKLRYASFIAAILTASVNSLIYADSVASPSTANMPVYSGSSSYVNNQNPVALQTLRVGIVNTKRCLEESKLGKQEKANFEKMKQQMESVLQDKERELEEIETKLDDEDYMDSISDEAASELKRKKRSLRSEGMQLQGQYMQTLQQANAKVVQRLTDTIAKASAQVVQETLNTAQPLDGISTDEAWTFYVPRLDVSDRVIAKMNAIFDAEQKDNPPKLR